MAADALASYGKYCGRHRGLCKPGEECAPASGAGVDGMDRLCKAHDECLRASNWPKGRAGKACDQTMCAAIQRGNFCGGNTRCTGYAAHARGVMCRSRSPNSHEDLR